MSRSLEIVTESPASVEQVYAAFRQEQYWQDRIEAGGDPNTALDSLHVDADGTVHMQATQHLLRHGLPVLVTKLIPGDLKIVHRETWKPVADGRVRGQINIAASGGLGGGRAEGLLEPVGEGSQIRFAARVEVKIPLLGGKFEKSIAAGLAENLPELQRFTTKWIGEHG